MGEGAGGEIDGVGEASDAGGGAERVAGVVREVRRHRVVVARIVASDCE